MSTATPTRVPTGTWNVDPVHSRVEFQVKHLGIASVRGNFAKFDGTLEMGDDLASARAYGTAEAASVDTGDDGRDTHLRSADFFDAEQHPEIAFTSRAISPTGDETFEITGEMTIHGVTRDLTLHAVITGTEQDPWGNERVGLEVTGQLNRSDYDITFNQALGSGNVVVSDKVKLRLDISAVKQS
ncbi:MAG: YceI family protein [Actinobacteria bacterium]|nr:YceI family protein [Actinomycetota bacterium]